MKIPIVFFLLIVFAGPIFTQTADERPPNIDLDRFYGLSKTEEQLALDSFFTFLSNIRHDGVIDIQFDPQHNRRRRINRIRRILKHIRYRNFDIGRLSFRLSEGSEDILTLVNKDLPFKGLFDEDDRHIVIKAVEMESLLKTLFREKK